VLLAFTVPLALICLGYWTLALFDRFWWWAFSYPQLYASQIDLLHGIVRFFLTMGPIWEAFSWLLLLALVGTISLTWDLKASGSILTLGLLTFSWPPRALRSRSAASSRRAGR
jgi:hypothetical protein